MYDRRTVADDGEQVPTGETGDRPFVRSLFADAAPTYDGVVRASTLGMDLLWKRRMFAAVPDEPAPRRILDMACGTGIVTAGLAERYPDAEVVGLDVSPEMLAVARERIDAGNVRFVERPAAEVTELGTDAFDLVTASYLPKYVDRRRLARDLRRVVRDGGAVVAHDFTYPRRFPLQAGFDAYWALLRRLIARVPGYDDISTELRELIVAAVGWPEELRDALDRAGFAATRIEWQPLEIAAIVVGADPPGRGSQAGRSRSTVHGE